MKMKRATWLLAALAMAAAGCDNSTVAQNPNAASHAAAAPAAATNSATSGSLNRPQTAPSSATSGAATGPGDILSVLSVEHQVDVSAPVDGVVVSVAKDEGSGVKAGDVLGQLDDRSLQLELVKAKDDLQVAQNNVQYKASELKAKKAALDRQKLLRADGLSSQADLEQAEFEAKAAEFDMHGWEAMSESSEAQIHSLELQIDRMKIRAPFSGVVVQRYVREGQTVQKNDKCFRVSQLAPLQVAFQVPESSARRPERGALVGLELAETSGRPLEARIVKISPTVDPASDSYNVTAQLTGPGISDLRPGMAVRVTWPATPAAPKP
ncbi:MAG: efflux RND transporter periplasmic adaptor subunit [Candidatus Acidiferrales bacterium]